MYFNSENVTPNWTALRLGIRNTNSTIYVNRCICFTCLHNTGGM